MEVSTDWNALSRKHEQGFTHQLLLSLPPHLMPPSNTHPHAHFLHLIQQACNSQSAAEELEDFLRELGVEREEWKRLESSSERFSVAVKQLEKSAEEGKRKVNAQVQSFLERGVGRPWREEKGRDPFEWLKLKNKYPLCEQKLKAKLVQAISDSKNEVRIRQRLENPKKPRVSLLDESLVMDEYEKMKIDYKWTEEDEQLLVNNINALKHKFNKTEFLKLCNRFKFISTHEFQTLAGEEISRKLDQDNKVFLSREFLLDKYYSTKDFLTEQEMRFILKTSPLLSKCVDKQFIRSAIKNIEYEDISRLELKIAEDIIARFDQIRKAVRESRKNFKHDKKEKIKEQIVEFQKRQELEVAREIARDELARHKLPHKRSSTPTPHTLASRHHFAPLNRYHPPSGLFVKDCNEQCTDDLFNNYERHYLTAHRLTKGRRGQARQAKENNCSSMLQFYTGGMESLSPWLSQEAISIICRVVRSHYYEKCLKMGLDSWDMEKCLSSNRTTQSVKTTFHTTVNLEKKGKGSLKAGEQSSEAAIKRKLVENKQKAKAVVYINKLLVLSAENNFTAFKALNAKYCSDQVNTKDLKGNTALLYVCRHNNLEFINHLLEAGADPSIPCEKDFTPLHYIFKTNNLALITRCLTGPTTPNLNAVNAESKTPLAYCSHDVLTRLNLQDGVALVHSELIAFDNNALLTTGKIPEKRRGSSRVNSAIMFHPE